MSWNFTPPLSTHTVVPIPRTPSKVTITFKAEAADSPQSCPPLPQVWTNLPSLSSPSSTPTEWREVAFLPLDVASSPPSDTAADWPVLSLSNAESPPLVRPPPPRFATLTFDVDESFVDKAFGYTLRLQHPNLQIQWLSSDGSDGSFTFELDEKDREEDRDGDKGRWEDDELVKVNRTAKGEQIKAKRWTGGERDFGCEVWQGWEGFGLTFDRTKPSAHLISPSSDSASSPTPLSTVILHPTSTNPPIHHVGLPHTPVILTADPSSFFILAGSSLKLKPSVEGFAPKASLVPSPTSSLSPTEGLEVGLSSGESTAVFAPTSKDLFLYSPIAAPVFPISIELSSLACQETKTFAIYSESGGSVVQLDVGKGGILVDCLPGAFSKLKVVELSRVDGTDLLVGSIEPPFASPSNKSTKRIGGGISHHIVEESPSDHEDTVHGDEDEEEHPVVDESGDEESQLRTEIGGGGGPGGFAAFLRFWAGLWQAVLSLFGFAPQPPKTVAFEDEVEVIPDSPTETTPLLAAKPPLHLSSPLSEASSATFSAPLLTPTLFAPAGLKGGLLISSPSSRDPPSLVIKARPLPSSSSSAWTELSLEGELKTVSNSQGGNWFMGVIGLGGSLGLETNGEGNWEVVVEERNA